MNSIDTLALSDATAEVIRLRAENPTLVIHTVTITLNGQHGGADLTIQGEVPDVRGGSWGDVEYTKVLS